MLTVSKISPGAVATYNAANPEEAVKVHDLIISVNGKGGDSVVMLDEMFRRKVRLEVERPHPAEVCELGCKQEAQY